MPITSVEDKAQRRLEVKARSTLMMDIPNKHQLKFNSVKDTKSLLEAIENRFDGNDATKKTQRNLLKQKYENFTASSYESLDQTFDRLQKLVSQLELLKESISQEDVNQKFLTILPSKWNMHVVVWRNKPDLDSMSMNDLQQLEVNNAFGVTTAGTQVTTANLTNIDNLSDAIICAFLASQSNSSQLNTGRKLDLNGNETVAFDKTKVEYYNFHKRGHFTRECRAPRAQDNRNRESTRRNVPIETTNSSALVSCDGLGGYKAGLKSVEERLEFFKTNESIYLEDVKKLKFEIHCNEITIRDLMKKLETVQRKKDDIQLTVEKLENASKSLNKLINSHIMDNCKKGLGYNAVPPPHTGLFMHPKPDLSYIGLEEFTSKRAVKTLNAKTSEEVSKVVKKDNGAPIIKDWKSDDEDESVPQPKIEKNTVKTSIAKLEFVKPK
nr:ribonuclease H-like domain-containing protein [Tanacetum cinerariifolium]